MWNKIKAWVSGSTRRLILVTVVATILGTLAALGSAAVGRRTYRAFVTLHRVAAQSDADHTRVDEDRKRLEEVIRFLNAQIEASKKQ